MKSIIKETLYRGRSKAPNELWLYGNVLIYENSAQIWEDTESGKWNSVVDLDTVGQWTHRTDSKGVKIFTDDILRHYSNYLGKNCYGIVKYDIETCAYIVKLLDGSPSAFLADWLSRGSVKCEVVGNIHDNPEYLDVPDLIEKRRN